MGGKPCFLVRVKKISRSTAYPANAPADVYLCCADGQKDIGKHPFLSCGNGNAYL